MYIINMKIIIYLLFIEIYYTLTNDQQKGLFIMKTPKIETSAFVVDSNGNHWDVCTIDTFSGGILTMIMPCDCNNQIISTPVYSKFNTDADVAKQHHFDIIKNIEEFVPNVVVPSKKILGR